MDDIKGYIVEVIQVRNSVKVTAIDPATSIEATVIGPSHSTKGDLEKLAIKKLQRQIDNSNK